MASVAIIGAGPAGLVAAKEALACGLRPTVFEKAYALGGLWRKSGGMWDSLQTNVSRHTQVFSDYAWKRGTPDFPNRAQVQGYLEGYADAFGLKPHMRLGAAVQKASPVADKWNVEWVSGGRTEQGSFNYLMVCSGIFSRAVTPHIPGIEVFPGSKIHASDYKSPESFKDKKVVVIGNSFSGCEIAAEVAEVAARVTHIAPHDFYILPRYLPKDSKELPLDLVFYSRSAHQASLGVPAADLNARKHRWFQGLTSNGLPESLAIKPDPSNPPFVAISDTYVDQVTKGNIHIVRDRVQSVVNRTLEFASGKAEADAIIFATGYRPHLPFFDQNVLDALGYNPNDPLQPLLLHKTVFAPDVSNMACIGMYRGPYFGVMELQARWATTVFAGKIPMPAEEEMRAGVAEELRIRDAIPRPQFPHGNYVEFCEDLARQIGVNPDVNSLTNPVLYRQIYEGPFTNASYRLSGLGHNLPVAFRMINDINSAV